MALENRLRTPWNEHVTLAVPPDFLYFNKRTNHNGTYFYEGLVFDILFAIADVRNISYNFIHGSGYSTKGNGIFALVAAEKADMAVGMLGMSHERQTVVDFTHGWRQVSLAFLISKSSHDSMYWYSHFSSTFNYIVWWTILGVLTTIIMAWAVTTVCEARIAAPSNSDARIAYPWWESLVILAAILFRQSITERRKKVNLFRPLMAVLFIGSLMITTSYTANLMAMKAVRIHNQIDTLEKLADHPDYNILVHNNSAEAELFKYSTNEVVKRIWKMINSSASNFIDPNTNNSVIARKLREGKYVFVSTTVLLIEVKRDKKDLLISKPWPGNPCIFGLSKSFQYSAFYILKIQQLVDAGIINRLDSLYQNNSVIQPENKALAIAVKMADVMSYFIWMSVGVMLSLIAVIVEVAVFNIKRKSS